MTKRNIKGSEFYRHGMVDEVVRMDDGEETREVWVAASSEEPVSRWFGPEVLVHEKKAIDLGFLAGGTAPVLDQHDHGRQIGVIKEVKLGKDRILRALLRFSKNAAASEVYEDIRDGIRKNVSIGYRIMDYTKVKDKDGNITEVRVTKWYPYEVSMVSVPADVKVGVGREINEKDVVMPDGGIDLAEVRRQAAQEAEERAEARLAAQAAEAAQEAAQRATEAAEARANEVTEIMELAARHNMTEQAAKHVRDGGDLSGFRGLVLTTLGDDAPLAPTRDVGLSQRELSDFSMFRLIRAGMRQASPADREAAAMEIEACNAAADMREGPVRGFAIPDEVLRNFITEDMSRTLLAGTDTQLIPTEHRAQSYIDILRNSSSVMRAGARTLPGLSGNVDIPRMLTSAGAAWLAAENANSADGEPTWETVSLSPKDVSRSTPMSRRMRQQSSPAIEGLVRLDIAQSIALAIDLGGLEGSGAAGQPTGVLNTTGVNKPAAFADVGVPGVPTFAEVVALETAVADDNALMGSLAYIGRTNQAGLMKTQTKDAGSGQFLLGADGLLNGYRFIQSNQGTNGNLYFGNWADLLIGMWGGLDLVMDEATLAAANGLYIRAFQTVDVEVRHPQSFAWNT